MSLSLAAMNSQDASVGWEVPRVLGSLPGWGGAMTGSLVLCGHHPWLSTSYFLLVSLDLLLHLLWPQQAAWTPHSWVAGLGGQPLPIPPCLSLSALPPSSLLPSP